MVRFAELLQSELSFSLEEKDAENTKKATEFRGRADQLFADAEGRGK